ncbi:MAG: IS66 family insertion sequence element accessory protein TnpB [Gammaproteobacteria bacterium]|jgi:transposase
MFFPESRVRIWLCTQSTDMRKSFNGLSALVKNKLQDNPLSGELFVFVNRRRNQMKILYFDNSGYCIWSKRLEQGQFVVRSAPEGKLQLNWTQLKLLLDGIEIKKSRQYKRYSHPSSGQF